MTVLGMGTVFVMLIILMAILILIGKLDSLAPATTEQAEPEPIEAEPAGVPVVEVRDPSGLTRDQIAAIAVAVVTHAEVRRKQGAPVNRVHAPGSRLWASRWVSMGRSAQMRNIKRR